MSQGHRATLNPTFIAKSPRSRRPPPSLADEGRAGPSLFLFAQNTFGCITQLLGRMVSAILYQRVAPGVDLIEIDNRFVVIAHVVTV